MGLVVFTWTLSSVEAKQVRLALLSSLALFVGSVMTFLLQGPYVAGKSWSAITDTGLMGDVLGTRLGIALVVRCALACVWGALAITIGRLTSALWKNVAFAASVATVFTFATSGHASAGSLPLLFISIDALHFLGIAVWVGGLLVMSLGSDHEQTSVARFSRLATWAMPLTVVTGIVQGLHLMGGLGDVTSTTFGKLLILKMALVVCVIYLGMKARRKIANLDSPLQRIVRREAAIVLIVLAVTSLMVGKTPSATEGAASQTFTTTQLQGDVLANIEIAPTKVGVMAVHVILSPPGGALSPVKTVEVQMSLGSKNIPPIPVNMVSLGPNHWSGIVQIPYSGTWDVEARVKPTETSTLLYAVQVKVKG